MGEVIQIIVPAPARPPVQVQQIVAPVPRVVEVVEAGRPGPPGDPGPQGDPGPRGPAGAAGGVALEQEFLNSSVWIIPIPAEFDRRPEVSIFLESGERVFTDVVVTAQFVTITFPTPTSGFAVLT